MMLISAGADTIVQKATTGEVNWGEVGVSFAAGAVGGGFAAAKLGATGLKGAVVAGMASGGVGGAAVSGYQYASGPGPHTVSGFVGATARGTATGVAFGGLGGAAGHGIVNGGSRLLSRVHPQVDVPTPPDTSRLTGRADDLSNALDEVAQNHRTSAVLATDGPDVLAGGGRDLNPAQRALVGENEVLAKLPNAHAEVTAVEHARANGLSPVAIGTSRDICPKCIPYLEESGATITGPRTAVWGPS